MAMGTKQMLLFLFLIILSHLANITTAQLPNFDAIFCTNSADYTTSTYQSNLDTVLSSLPFETSNNYGFYNTPAGQDPDTVYPAALCRGDISHDICRHCVSNATHKLRELCHSQKEAIGWYDYCMLRYSNDRVFHRVDPNFYTVFAVSDNNVTSAELAEFSRQLTNLTEHLQGEAAAGGPLRKFATGSISGPDPLTIYGLMQCNPDLSETECSSCLNNIRTLIPQCCLNDTRRRTGGRVIRPNCNLRYEVDKFYNDTPAISLPQPPPPRPPSYPPSYAGNNTTRTIIIIVAVISVILAAAILIWIYNFIRKRKQTTMEIPNAATEYDLKEIRHATDDFSPRKKLGQGAFGAVYEGRLKNGKKIAVKKLIRDSTQADRDLRNEVSLLAKLQHRNLVSLLGFCRDGTRILLIYELVANATLANYIFGVEGIRAKTEIIDWDKLYKIIEGVARGLLYLHVDSQRQIIHRDLKPSNILLDKDMNPKIADFGTARLLMLDATHCSTIQPMGTPGYMAPEYTSLGQYSVKTDVYSFGIILLEILTGKKISQSPVADDPHDNLLSYVWRNWQAKSISGIINSALSRTDPSSLQCIMRCIHIGLLCIQENAIRPTMDLVSQWLHNQSITLDKPKMPAFLLIINQPGSSVHEDLTWTSEEFQESPMLLT